MTVDQVRSVHAAQPFQPFVLHLADGRSITVEHREFMMVSPRGDTASVYRPDGILDIIGLSLVTDLEVKLGRNGSAKRRKS